MINFSYLYKIKSILFSNIKHTEVQTMCAKY
jgi:hypothetical protein